MVLHVADRGLWFRDRRLSMKLSGFPRSTRETRYQDKWRPRSLPVFGLLLCFLGFWVSEGSGVTGVGYRDLFSDHKGQ